jgi:ribonucleoside-diphosphate reductase beta chain
LPFIRNNKKEEKKDNSFFVVLPLFFLSLFFIVFLVKKTGMHETELQLDQTVVLQKNYFDLATDNDAFMFRPTTMPSLLSSASGQVSDVPIVLDEVNDDDQDTRSGLSEKTVSRRVFTLSEIGGDSNDVMAVVPDTVIDRSSSSSPTERTTQSDEEQGHTGSLKRSISSSSSCSPINFGTSQIENFDNNISSEGPKIKRLKTTDSGISTDDSNHAISLDGIQSQGNQTQTKTLRERLVNADTQYFDRYTSMHNLNWRLVVPLADDAVHWNTKLTDKQRKVMTHVFGYFSVADDVVLQNLGDNVEPEILAVPCFTINERHDIELALAHQKFTECLHKKTYSRILDIAIPNKADQEAFLKDPILNHSIDKKVKWAERFMDRNLNRLLVRLVAFACVEQIHFSTSFLTIFWLKFEHGDPLPGVSSYNEYINRDEAQHFKLFCEIILDMINRGYDTITKEEIHEVIMSAVEAEIAFFTEAIPEDMAGFKLNQVIEYIKCMGNTVSLALNVGLIYEAKNYFAFMALIDQDVKMSFLEPVRSTQYRETHTVKRPLNIRKRTNSSPPKTVTPPETASILPTFQQ